MRLEPHIPPRDPMIQTPLALLYYGVWFSLCSLRRWGSFTFGSVFVLHVQKRNITWFIMGPTAFNQFSLPWIPNISNKRPYLLNRMGLLPMLTPWLNLDPSERKIHHKKYAGSSSHCSVLLPHLSFDIINCHSERWINGLVYERSAWVILTVTMQLPSALFCTQLQIEVNPEWVMVPQWTWNKVNIGFILIAACLANRDSAALGCLTFKCSAVYWELCMVATSEQILHLWPVWIMIHVSPPGLQIYINHCVVIYGL